MTTTIPYNIAGWGQADYSKIDDYVFNDFRYGPIEDFVTWFGTPAASQTLKQWQVIGKNASGEIVPATYNANPALAIKPIGVLITADATGNFVVPASNTGLSVSYWISGGFFLTGAGETGLVWDASFDTDAKKLAAFEGAPTPTEIFIKKRFA